MPVSVDYKDKVVFITGGGRGIGLGATTAFAQAGATVVVTYNSQDPTDKVKPISELYNVPIHVFHCPGEDTRRVNEVIDIVSQRIGEVDVVVANAGVCQWRDCVDMSDEDWNFVISCNLTSPITLARGFVRHWLGMTTAVMSSEDAGKPIKRIDLKKRILCVSSISGVVNTNPQRQVSYNASKAGLTMACKTLAGEWAKYGVTVNSISPGYISTDMINHPPQGEGAKWPLKWMEDTPVRRFADPLEVGQMMVLICSDQSSTFMTGHDLIIDGGFTTY